MVQDKKMTLIFNVAARDNKILISKRHNYHKWLNILIWRVTDLSLLIKVSKELQQSLFWQIRLGYSYTHWYCIDIEKLVQCLSILEYVLVCQWNPGDLNDLK